MSLAARCRLCGVGVVTVLALGPMFDHTTSAVSRRLPIVVSRPSPFARCSVGRSVNLSDGSTGYVNTGDTDYTNTGVEPDVAANPRTAETGHINLIGVWQQDRWSNGGARGVVAAYSFDSGRTWGETALPFSTCASRHSPFVRASDGWVSIGPDGMAYASAVGLGSSTNAVLVSTSMDGGKTWERLRGVIRDRTSLYQNDKPSITADPIRPGVAYATWNRTRQPLASHHLRTWFAVTTDGGRTWSAPRQIAPAPDGANAIGHQIVVDAKRDILYNVFLETLGQGDPDESPREHNGAQPRTVTRLIAFVKSADGGRTWSSPRVIARVPALNPLVDFLYRLGYPLPTAAVDPVTGTLYVAWTDARVDEGDHPEIVLATSVTGGSSWGTLHRMSGPRGAPAFTPAIAVGRHGYVGVAFYSANQLYASNTDSDPNPPRVLVNEWLAGSYDGGRHFGTRVHVGGPFNFWAAPFANGYFLGDYQGLAASGQDFFPFFVTTRGRAGRSWTDIATAAVSGQ